MNRYFTATRDLFYEDVLIALKGEKVIVNSNNFLINKARGVKIVNAPAVIEKWIAEEDKLSPQEVNLGSVDNVNHPQHYCSHPSKVECIDITRHYCFSIGNAIKYLWRAGLKKDASLDDRQKEIEDLKKAIWYINDRIAQLRNEAIH